MPTCDCDNLQVLSKLLFFSLLGLTTNVVRKSHAHCITTENTGCTLTTITILLETEYESLSLPFSRRQYLYVLVIQVVLILIISDLSAYC